MGLIRRQTSTGSQQSMGSEYLPTGYDAAKDMYDPEGGNMHMTRSSSSSSSFGRSSSKPLVSSNTLWKYLTVAQHVVFLCSFLQCFSAHHAYRGQMSLLSDATESYDTLYRKFVEIETELQHTHDDFTHLNFQLHAIAPRGEPVEVETSEDRKRVANSFIGRAAAQEERIQSLKTEIQKSETARLIQVFGKGPYAIEVSVIIEGKTKYFTIQTAPSHIAPHATLRFLEMVHKKFWDSTVLYHQVEHVVIGVPVDINGVRKESELNKPLLFPESSPDFPHVANTIGFKGTPGGPEFYINLDDNSDIHGPGGQAGDHMNDGESCFGTIIHGIDVMEDFIKLNKKAMMSEEGVYYSAIKQMKFITIARRQ